MLDVSALVYGLAASIITILLGVITYYKWAFGYWKRRGLEYLEPSIPFGNTANLLTGKVNFGRQFAEFYHEFKAKGLKHGGIFMFARPFYVPVDPLIYKNILQKDFSHFVNRGFYVNEENDPMSGHLFALEGDKWKNLRAKLTATFTSGKMKMMFETVRACGDQLGTIMKQAALNRTPVDIKEILACYTTDVITSCAFGLDGNSLKDPSTPLRYYGKRIVENTSWENIKNLSQFMFPPKLLDVIKYKSTKNDVENFMMDLVKKTVDYREKNNLFRKDFLHLLLQLKNRGKIVDDENVFDNNNEKKEVGLTINELVAQVFVFFAAGFETSSTTMNFTLFELAQQQEIQDTLRKEINTVLKKHNNDLTYEAIMEMTYMEQVINETLRKYPPLPFLNRKCTKAYDIPNTNIHLEEGTMMVIPIVGIHYDPEYFPNPSKYDPDRFSDKNKNIVPFTWMPFGEGPRVCIGLRFGVLQSKIGLAMILKNHRVTLNEKTETPLIYEPTSLTTSTKSKIWLDIAKVNS